MDDSLQHIHVTTIDIAHCDNCQCCASYCIDPSTRMMQAVLSCQLICMSRSRRCFFVLIVVCQWWLQQCTHCCLDHQPQFSLHDTSMLKKHWWPCVSVQTPASCTVGALVSFVHVGHQLAKTRVRDVLQIHAWHLLVRDISPRSSCKTP